MKVLVTGATGRVGANVVKKLAEAGNDVTAAMLKGDKQEPKLDGLRCRKAYFDILDPDAVAAAIRGADAVVHTAAVMENMADKMPRSKFFDINVKGAFNVLEGVRQSGSATRLICFSSTAAYDVTNCPRTPVKEDLPLRPLSLYGMNKVLIEAQVKAMCYQYDIPFTLLRPNYVVAGEEVLNIFRCGVVRSMLREMAGNKKTQLYATEDPDGWHKSEPLLRDNKEKLCIPRCPGGQSWRWHMTDVRDVAELVDFCLTRDEAVGQTFNIAARDACEWPEVVSYIAKKTVREVVEVEIPNLWQFSFDQSATKTKLGFTPRHDHKDIVDAAIAFRDKKDIGIIAGSIAPLAFEPA